ncbi:uncharacterized protein LOC111085155 isoform X2 [Limulus polyphemus]|nr:uncharacterized protein LOC111085155 isoform X2 [Limulus polyphemus]XP_022238235.1 uncharacterized protein LOC111085155 isoform X2 [Limulus polyphemus]XP_022238236.1 uncharacterized protein LOC111085155 isoform X2 [Limulus polyphemus]
MGSSAIFISLTLLTCMVHGQFFSKSQANSIPRMGRRSALYEIWRSKERQILTNLVTFLEENDVNHDGALSLVELLNSPLRNFITLENINYLIGNSETLSKGGEDNQMSNDD